MRGGVSDRGTVGGLAQRVGYGRLYKFGTRKGVLVLFGHGSQDSVYNLDDTEPFGYLTHIHGAGFPTASLDDTTSKWGNSTMRTNIGTLKTNLQTAVAASGKVHILAWSAGVAAAYNYAKNNPTLVQSIFGILPCVDVQAIHAGDLGGFAAEIASAYGGGAPGDADNPADNASSFTAIPQKLYYSTDDTIATASSVTTFAATSGASTASLGAIGHTYTTLPVAAAAAFFSAND